MSDLEVGSSPSGSEDELLARAEGVWDEEDAPDAIVLQEGDTEQGVTEGASSLTAQQQQQQQQQQSTVAALLRHTECARKCGWPALPAVTLLLDCEATGCAPCMPFRTLEFLTAAPLVTVWSYCMSSTCERGVFLFCVEVLINSLGSPRETHSVCLLCSPGVCALGAAVRRWVTWCRR